MVLTLHYEVELDLFTLLVLCLIPVRGQRPYSWSFCIVYGLVAVGILFALRQVFMLNDVKISAILVVLQLGLLEYLRMLTFPHAFLTTLKLVLKDHHRL